MTPEEIKSLRKGLGLTQQEFAGSVGVSFASVNRWENGASKPGRLAIERMHNLSRKGSWPHGGGMTMADDRLDRIEALLEKHAQAIADFDKQLADGAAAFDKSLANSAAAFDKKLEDWAKGAAKRDAVFDKRIAALIARDEALQARHEALSESVEMMAQGWLRRGTPPPPQEGA